MRIGPFKATTLGLEGGVPPEVNFFRVGGGYFADFFKKLLYSKWIWMMGGGVPNKIKEKSWRGGEGSPNCL